MVLLVVTVRSNDSISMSPGIQYSFKAIDLIGSNEDDSDAM